MDLRDHITEGIVVNVLFLFFVFVFVMFIWWGYGYFWSWPVRNPTAHGGCQARCPTCGDQCLYGKYLRNEVDEKGRHRRPEPHTCGKHSWEDIAPTQEL